MDLFSVSILLIVLAAVFAFVNVRFLRLPTTIGLLLISILFTGGLFLTGYFYPKVLATATELVAVVDFRKVLMDFMLCILLFAGALHTNVALLFKNKTSVIVFATVGVIVAAAIVGITFYFLMGLIGLEISLEASLIFGALISPTDPVAVLGILKKARVPEDLEIRIVGESLFNDGFGMVVFLALLAVGQNGFSNFDAGETGFVFLEEVGGGVLLGLILGYLTYRMLRAINNYETEVLITLAMVLGGYALALYLHFSGPLAMVVAGLFLGNETAKTATSELTELYLEKFWELADMLLNAVLFVLIGLSLLNIDFDYRYIIAGLISIPVVLGARFLALGLPVRLLRKKTKFLPNTGIMMTWGGLRGGISIALALSIPDELYRDLILQVTYVVVVFSILVQGLTLGPVVRYFLRKAGHKAPAH